MPEEKTVSRRTPRASKRKMGEVGDATRGQQGPTDVAEGAGFENAVRERAYAIWEAEGRPDGRATTHWQRAQDELGVREVGPETPPRAQRVRKSAASG